MTFFKFPDEIEPYLIVGFLVLYIAFRLYPLLLGGNKPKTELPLGAPRDYGIPGGAICPQCHRPFRLGWSTFKIGFGPKLARCGFCGTGYQGTARGQRLHRLPWSEEQDRGSGLQRGGRQVQGQGGRRGISDGQDQVRWLGCLGRCAHARPATAQRCGCQGPCAVDCRRRQVNTVFPRVSLVNPSIESTRSY